MEIRWKYQNRERWIPWAAFPFFLKKGDLWLDIACNDGTLLSFVPNEINKLGIDPADDSYYNESSKIADDIVQDYFSYKTFQQSKFSNNQAKVITTIAMFYDLMDPHPFINDVCKVLDDNGIWVLQLSYTPLMIKQLAFDNICHEHLEYYSLHAMKHLLDMHDMEVVDRKSVV